MVQPQDPLNNIYTRATVSKVAHIASPETLNFLKEKLARQLADCIVDKYLEVEVGEFSTEYGLSLLIGTQDQIGYRIQQEARWMAAGYPTTAY
jgi:hypothetical protein